MQFYLEDSLPRLLKLNRSRPQSFEENRSFRILAPMWRNAISIAGKFRFADLGRIKSRLPNMSKTGTGIDTYIHTYNKQYGNHLFITTWAENVWIRKHLEIEYFKITELPRAYCSLDSYKKRTIGPRNSLYDDIVSVPTHQLWSIMSNIATMWNYLHGAEPILGNHHLCS